MKSCTVIDGNAFYEIDEECMKRKAEENRKREEKSRKKEYKPGKRQINEEG